MKISIKCPNCGDKFCVISESEQEVEGATFDCTNCNTLLVQKENKIYKFHEWLHKQDSRWPVDGSGTYSI